MLYNGKMESVKVSPNDYVFVLTGAGISVESGLPAFRSKDGTWNTEKLEDVCTPGAWERDPWKVWNFYSSRRREAALAMPNPAHYALAELEKKMGDRFFLCTQNVDDLHDRAGSQRMIHMHGELAKARCSDGCSAPVTDKVLYDSLQDVNRCLWCGALLRPHIVFFEETPLELNRIDSELDKVTLMIVIGTSGTVFPAAGFIHEARMRLARTVYIGPEPPVNHKLYHELILKPASEVVYEVSE